MNNDRVSEKELVRMARQVLNAASRNEVARGNENNITIITNLIISDTESGDVITTESCRELLRNNGVNHEYATRNAIIYALRDLVKSGYLAEPESMADDVSDRWGRTRYVKAYKVK
jgi:plasmid replication initiation protein